MMCKSSALSTAVSIFLRKLMNSLVRWRGTLHVKGGKQRRGAVALVIVRHRLGPPLFERQARLRAVERLDLALLVDAQHQGTLRRVHVKADNIDNLLGEHRIVRDLESAHDMRLKAGSGPHALHAAMADADGLGHLACAPMRSVGRLFSRRLLDNGELLFGRKRRDARGPRLVAQQARHTFIDVTLLPAPYARLRLARAPHDGAGAEPIRGGQYYFSAPATLALAVAVGHDRLQLGPIRRAQVKANVVASHVDPLHAVNQRYA